MTDSIVTQLGRPSDDPTTRAKAIRYLTRTGNADLLPILGLVDADAALVERRAAKARSMFNGRGVPEDLTAQGYSCGICGNPLPMHGFCRRSKACRAVTEIQEAHRWMGGDR